MNKQKIIERCEELRNPAIALVVVFVVLLLYLIGYPTAIIKIDDGGHLENGPDWLVAVIEWTLIPLEWTYEWVGWYEKFLDWWVEKL